MKLIAYTETKPIQPCTLPYRVVLRDNGREFVTHIETCPDGTPDRTGEVCHGFHHGHYFRYDDEAEAIGDFRARATHERLDIVFDDGTLNDGIYAI